MKKKDGKHYGLAGIILTSCTITISSFSKRWIEFHLKFAQFNFFRQKIVQFINSSKQKITACQTNWKNNDRRIHSHVSSSSFSCPQSLAHQTQ
jgi:hypothetical protein